MTVNADALKLIDEAQAAGHKTTVGYVNKYWKTPPPLTWWGIHETKLAEAKALLIPPPLPPPPTPPPAPVGGVLELAGVYTTASFAAAVQSAGAGYLTVRPKQGSTVVVNGTLPARDATTFQSIVFDGQHRVNQNYLTDWHQWKLVGCTFRGYFIDDGGVTHSEALYVGGGCMDGVIDNCTFDDNGNTAHIFFTWFGGRRDPYDVTNYPQRICVRNSHFANGHNPWFAIQYRDEIPADAPIFVDPSNVFVGPGSQRPLKACPA